MTLQSAVCLAVFLGMCVDATGAAAQPVSAGAPAPPVLRLALDGGSAAGWRVQGGKADTEMGAMALRGRSGWVGSHQPLANFVLTFEARLDDPAARAGVVVRAWPTFDRDTGAVTNAYRIVLAAGDDAGTVIHHRFEQSDPVVAGTAAAPASTRPGAWHVYRIEGTGSTLRTYVDGRLVSTASDVENPQGFVGFVAERGLVEIRYVSIEPARRVVQQPHPDAESMSTPGISPPQILYEAKPRFTPAAMRARIQGSVLLSGVVDEDGQVRDARVVLSLDPMLGLDAEALAALAQWRFRPGTRDGRPVRVAVMIEMSFNLR